MIIPHITYKKKLRISAHVVGGTKASIILLCLTKIGILLMYYLPFRYTDIFSKDTKEIREVFKETDQLRLDSGQYIQHCNTGRKKIG